MEVETIKARHLELLQEHMKIQGEVDLVEPLRGDRNRLQEENQRLQEQIQQLSEENGVLSARTLHLTERQRNTPLTTADAHVQTMDVDGMKSHLFKDQLLQASNTVQLANRRCEILEEEIRSMDREKQELLDAKDEVIDKLTRVRTTGRQSFHSSTTGTHDTAQEAAEKDDRFPGYQ